jgi:arylsulfatase A-like enzyme
MVLSDIRWSTIRRFVPFWVVMALLLPAMAQGVNLPQQPNIVVVMVDDLDVGLTDRLLGMGAVPNIKSKMVDNGYKFNNAFVTNSFCCPSRATFLTGQYSHNHGVLRNYPPNGGAPALDDSSTIATWLNAGGYHTGHIGKYLNGYGQFDMNGDGEFTIDDQTYIPPGWDEWRGLIDPSTYRVYDFSVNNNGVIQTFGSSESDYQTDVLSDYVQEFLLNTEQSDDTPFFLVVTPLAPHLEIPEGSPAQDYHDIWQWDIRPAPRHAGTLALQVPQPPSFNESNVSDKPLWLQQQAPMTYLDKLFLARHYRHRAESMRSVDDLLGSLFETLETYGELDHTVVLFTSDNGFLHGEHRLSEKGFAFEEAIRVPLFIRLPGEVGGVSIDQDVLNNDLAPTIAELAGVSVGHAVDGRSIIGLFDQAPISWRKRFLVEHYASRPGPLNIPTYTAIRTVSYGQTASPLVFVNYLDPEQTNEFYDLGIDPYQRLSLHNVPALQGQIELNEQFLDIFKICKETSCVALEDYDNRPALTR